MIYFYRYIGVAILAISKWLMHQFHYQQIVPAFKSDSGKPPRVLMTDTDSLTYHFSFPPEIVYEKLKNEVAWMDFSNYQSSKDFSHLYCGERYLIPGYFKDEVDGNYIIEFIGM